MSDKNSGKEGAGAHKKVHKKINQNQGYKAIGSRSVPQLLLQHSLALRMPAVGLTYAYWLTSVEHSPL